MVSVVSKDGTRITASVGGDGRPVVLVHGICGSDFSWVLVRPYLELLHTVYAIQRRGRGQSGDHPEYSLTKEAEDIAALVDSIGEPVALVGHSFGANCALEASLLTTNLRWLVLYEPVFAEPTDESMLGRIEAYVAAGMGAEAVETYLVEAVGLGNEEMVLLRASPFWQERVAAAGTLSREDRAVSSYRLASERFAGMRVPTLLLTGTESLPKFRRSVEDVHRALSRTTFHVLDGQGHSATVSAPGLVAAEITQFIGSG